MAATDWAPLISAGGLFITSVAIPWAIAEYRKRTGIELTTQQIATFQSAAQTVTGLVENKLAQGELTVADVHPDNPTIQALAADAIARIPATAAALGSGASELAAIATARVNTSPPAPVLSAVAVK